MKNNKGFKCIVIYVIAVILAIISTFSIVNDNIDIQVAMGEEYSFEDDYKLYKEYADNYIKTWDKKVVKDKNVTISSSINDGFIKVTVDGEISKLEARYPIVVKVNEKTSQTTILYKSGIYEKSTNLISKSNARCIIIILLVVLIGLYYYFIRFIVWLLDETVKSIKEKIYQNMKQKEENNN